MPRSYRNISNETISNATTVKDELIEKILELRSSTYLSQIKAKLLTNTIFEIDHSKKQLFNTNTRLEQEICDRKIAEERLEDALIKAEEATKLKDKFVALVSHDLKTPLHQIMGFLQLTQVNAEELSDDTNENIEESLKACSNMNDLINDILNLSRIKNGELKPTCTTIDAAEIISEAIDSYVKMANKKGINLINEVPAHSYVYADKKLLYEVVSNLVTNSIKFCNNGDSIRVFTSQDDISTIVISDTGIGIAEKIIDNIFCYEKKTSTTGTLGEQGTGFGLPLCYDIIKSHGGSLKVETLLGGGTSFFISLPQTTNEDIDL